MIFANLISRLPDPLPRAKKVLVLAHREELLSQAQRQIQRITPNLRVSIEKGKQWGDMDDSDVIVASVPTLGRRGDDGGPNLRLQRFEPDEFKAIIIDEAHHSVAESYLRILRYFGISYSNIMSVTNEKDKDKFESDSPGYEAIDTKERDHLLVWGCSATLSRNDELALGTLFEKVVYHRDLAFMMKEGWLCPVRNCEVFTDSSLEKVGIRDNELDQRELSLAIDTPTRNNLVAATWLRVAREEHNRRATIVFALNIKHVLNLAASFSSLGIEVAIITSETDGAERNRILETFIQGKVPVLLNCAVLTEGTDLPVADCIVMTRPTCNLNLYIQMVGRGLRKHSEKKYCLIVDFLDKWRQANRSLVTMPSLLAAKDYKKSSSSTKDRISNLRDIAEIDASEISIGINKKEEAEVFKVTLPKTPLAWFEAANNCFVLAGCTLTFMIQVSTDPNQHETLAQLLMLRTNEKGCGTQRYNLVGTSSWEPLNSLLDSFIMDLKNGQGEYLGHPCDLFDFYKSNAFWRRSRPPSPGQKKFLNHILNKIPKVQEWERAQIYAWSKGRAADFVVKYLIRTRLLKIPIESFQDFIKGLSIY